MIAIDWSHTKELTTYDGKKVRIESQKALLSRLKKDGQGESTTRIISSKYFNSPSVIIENGSPQNLIYNILLTGTQVYLIDNHATEQYRQENNIEKTDENDAKIIYELALNGYKNKLREVTLDDRQMMIKDLYHQYCRYQKARVAMENMKKAHMRHYQGLESTTFFNSNIQINSKPDLLPYTIAIDTLEAREKSLLKSIESIFKDLPLFESGGESIQVFKFNTAFQPPDIRGLGKRIWIGIIATCNPRDFRCLSAYLRYCGLNQSTIESHKYNRHARMLYHMLAESVIKARNIEYRATYDKCKEDIATSHPDYTKLHIHNAALNRTATFLAKSIYNYVHNEVEER